MKSNGSSNTESLAKELLRDLELLYGVKKGFESVLTGKYSIEDAKNKAGELYLYLMIEKNILIILNKMKEQIIVNIGIILNQFGGPIKLSSQTKTISNISIDLVQYHLEKYTSLNDYNISELFSLYSILEYAIKDLGEEEFNLVTGLDLYLDGYKILNYIRILLN